MTTPFVPPMPSASFPQSEDTCNAHLPFAREETQTISNQTISLPHSEQAHNPQSQQQQPLCESQDTLSQESDQTSTPDPHLASPSASLETPAPESTAYAYSTSHVSGTPPPSSSNSAAPEVESNDGQSHPAPIQEQPASMPSPNDSIYNELMDMCKELMKLAEDNEKRLKGNEKTLKGLEKKLGTLEQNANRTPHTPRSTQSNCNPAPLPNINEQSPRTHNALKRPLVDTCFHSPRKVRRVTANNCSPTPPLSPVSGWDADRRETILDTPNLPRMAMTVSKALPESKYVVPGNPEYHQPGLCFDQIGEEAYVCMAGDNVKINCEMKANKPYRAHFSNAPMMCYLGFFYPDTTTLTHLPVRDFCAHFHSIPAFTQVEVKFDPNHPYRHVCCSLPELVYDRLLHMVKKAYFERFTRAANDLWDRADYRNRAYFAARVAQSAVVNVGGKDIGFWKAMTEFGMNLHGDAIVSLRINEPYGGGTPRFQVQIRKLRLQQPGS